MGEFQNQMLQDVLGDDGLIIAARGLGVEQVLINLLNVYSEEGNLVLVIGTSSAEEEYFISQLKKQSLKLLPKSITGDCLTSSRSDIYHEGGCIFVTSRILVMDLLMERIPIDLITGIVIWKADRILESCQEAFILRLYRLKNKTGFIKAFSANPLAFTVGFFHVERVMRNLFVKKLFLWPRFRLEVSDWLTKFEQPEVIELHLQMTADMKQIQMATLDLISSTLQELKLSNRALNFEEFCTENAISHSFDRMLKMHLDPVWHQLSVRSKQLLSDLKVLRTVLTFLTQYDAVTFYSLVNSLMTTEKAIQSAGWMILPAAELLVHHARMRVFKEEKKAEKVPSSCSDAKKRGIKDIDPEANPKWTTISEVLEEIRKESINEQSHCKCLIFTHDDKTANQLGEYIEDGGSKILKRNFYQLFGSKYGLTTPDSLKKDKITNPDSSGCIRFDLASVGKSSKRKREPEKDGEDVLTLTQITKRYPLVVDDPDKKQGESKDFPDGTETSRPSGDNKTSSARVSISICSAKDHGNTFKMLKILEEFTPDFIVMYDVDLQFIRQIEVWQARNPGRRRRIYFLIYKGTVEEQIYLTSIRREKDAFEYLIKEKSTMVIPEYAEGRHDDHPDLRRDVGDAASSASNEVTRKGGGFASQEECVTSPVVVVDMREFRSELPSILHRRGIDIHPATIEVGDYILSPEICVERKSISDLIGSLNSGRLYNQALSMTRNYNKPILLIEFDHTKPFHSQGRFFLSSDASASPTDVCSRLQLLTLHFPQLRLLWSPSPHATAELFHMLKAGKKEPSVSEAQSVNSDQNADLLSDQFNPQIKDFVARLPGVTSKNIYSILRKTSSLTNLFTKSLEELSEILGNDKEAAKLHNALHSTLTENDSFQVEAKKPKLRTKFGKKVLKR